MKIIDPHLHLFNLDQGDYHWLKADNPPFWPDKSIISKNFIEQDLTLNQPLHLAGFVHIEAGFDNLNPWREVAWLEQHCRKPFRTIAFLDLSLEVSAFKSGLNKLKQFSSVVGIRHIFDDDALALQVLTQVKENLALVAEQALLFELQMPLDNLAAVDNIIAIAKAVPKLQLIINHAGWPTLNSTENNTENNTKINAKNSAWLTGLQCLSQVANCAIKCSGWEMSDRTYQLNTVKIVINDCLEYFGDDRVMLASNFPLCLFSHSYQDYWDNQIKLIEQLDNHLLSKKLNKQLSIDLLKEKLCYSNAQRWYKFTHSSA
jgi:predicted TIM-barrel fold metal-dependent hydrolase